jgi:hypothetical protein
MDGLCIVLIVDTNASEEYLSPSPGSTLKKEAAYSSKTLISTYKASRYSYFLISNLCGVTRGPVKCERPRE